MALTIEKLNDDATFLLAFAPTFAPKKPGRKFPGAFTILIDPWLNGDSSILHPVFQVSRHTSACALKSLADLVEQPDLVIISQDKPDHCHRETLCTLPRNTETSILAIPSAAKKIRSWKYFAEDVVHEIKPYHAKQKDTIVRIPLASYTSSSSKGEITIANIATRLDMTGLHNAIGITYRPPGSLLTALNDETIDLAELVKPEGRPKLHKSRSAIKLPTEPITPMPARVRPRTASSPKPCFLDPQARTQTMPGRATPPVRERSDSVMEKQSSRPCKEKALSVIYTPHGISTSALAPYVTSHLRQDLRQDLPPSSPDFRLTALLHCMNTEENPWLLGGMVANGAPTGVEICKQLGAKHWVSTHDERKDNGGVSVAWLRSTRYGLEDVRKMLDEDDEGKDTRLHLLDVGRRMRVEG